MEAEDGLCYANANADHSIGQLLLPYIELGSLLNYTVYCIDAQVGGLAFATTLYVVWLRECAHGCME